MSTKWWQVLDENKDDLRNLISEWHPGSEAEQKELSVTSSRAEATRLEIANHIAMESINKPGPLRTFDLAVLAKDKSKIIALLNGAWLGVPESTSCWSIPGFKILCDLCDGSYDDDC